MKFLIKKIYIIFFLLIILLNANQVFARDNKVQYVRKDISNYLLGIISVNENYNEEAFKYLKKVQSIKDKHSQFNIEFIRTLVLLEKFQKAFVFSKSVWDEDELYFETDLLLGLDSFIKKDYIEAEKYFERLNKISRYNLFFDNFVGNVLMAWVRASQGNKEESFKFLEKIPNSYHHLKRTQDIFLQCYFDIDSVQNYLEELIDDKDYNFSRYNFFLINYLLSKNKTAEAQQVIQNSRKKHRSNLLLKQTEFFFLNSERKKIRNFFNCKNPKDSLAEFFYVIANLYSSEEDYKKSNFYLKISLFLNNKFLSNKALLAENFYYQNKNTESKNIYNSLKSIGPVYSWYASKNIASILLEEKGKKYAVDSLKKTALSAAQQAKHSEIANYLKAHGAK